MPSMHVDNSLLELMETEAVAGMRLSITHLAVDAEGISDISESGLPAPAAVRLPSQ